MLDHILLGVRDLDEGIASIEKVSGVLAVVGGAHPGAGTRNALLALGTGQYLEIIAPDPRQPLKPDSLGAKLAELPASRLVAWAWRTRDMRGLAERIAKAGVASDGPLEGSRRRPDGELLRWKTLRMKDDLGGILPFFIEWETGAKHPSEDAPAGCRLLSFSIASENPEELRETFRRIEIDVKIEKGETQKLRATVEGARGKFELTS